MKYLEMIDIQLKIGSQGFLTPRGMPQSTKVGKSVQMNESI